MEFDRYIKSLPTEKRFKIEIETAKLYLRDHPPDKYKQYSNELIWALDVILLGGNSGEFIKLTNQAIEDIRRFKDVKNNEILPTEYLWVNGLYDLYLKNIRLLLNKLEKEKK